jgi:site-specific recombinase XerC
MVDPGRAVLITGPLASHKNGLIGDLRRQGYAPSSIEHLLRLVAQLSRWLVRRHLRPADLTVARLDGFLRFRRRVGYVGCPTIRGLDAILRYLKRLGIVPVEEQQVLEQTPHSELLHRYGKFLAEERSVSPAVIRAYQGIAHRFLSSVQVVQGTALAHLRTTDVSGFIVAQARRLRVSSAKLTVTGLRSFLRYLHIRGDIPGDLSGAVPAIAGWRLAGLPKALDPEQAGSLLLTFDRRTRAGRRGYSVVMLLLRMGLRAGEVAALRLNDCDWSRGELTIRGKQGREDRLPIPKDVGEAIVAYLRFARPRSALRGLFLSELAPCRNMTSSMVKRLVRNAGKRCGIANLGILVALLSGRHTPRWITGPCDSFADPGRR